MIITGAFLAEAATAVDNKLDVRGGVLSSYRVGQDRMVNVMLVVLTQTEAGDRDVRLNVETVRPDGDMQAAQAVIPDVALTSQNGFAVFPLVIKAEANGRYVLILTCGGSSFSLLLSVFD